jgi:hypothetical protein
MITAHINGVPVAVHTADGRALDAIWCEAKPPSKHGAAILFHPNSAICLDMVPSPYLTPQIGARC